MLSDTPLIVFLCIGVADGFKTPALNSGPKISKVGRTCETKMSDEAAMPWKRISSPVYSVSSSSKDGTKTMNIATYVSAASIPREGKDLFYSVALFKTSLSYANAKETGQMLLQLLSKQQAKLVDLLGKTSGREVDKISALREQGIEVAHFKELAYLEASLAVCDLEVVDWMDADDHEISLCKVRSTFNIREGDVLYTDFLREVGILAKP